MDVKLKKQEYFETRMAFDEKRSMIWPRIVAYLQRYIPRDAKVLDLGAGYCDFINNIEAKEKYALDSFAKTKKYAKKGVTVFQQSCLQPISLTSHYLDVVFASNFFEHLTPEEFDKVIWEVKRVLKKGGRLIIIQPNFRYCYAHYFDDYTHRQIFTDLGFADLLISKGFEIEKKIARLLPFSFKSRLPKIPWLVSFYLKLPFRPFAKQFLIIARNVR